MSFFHALLSSGVSQSYDLQKFALNYRTSDFAYITSAAFSDCSSFLIDNVIRVVTAGTPDTNFVTGVFYLYATDPNNERIYFKDADGSYLVIWDNSFSLIGTVGSGFFQAQCVDPVNGKIYSYNDAASTVAVKDLSGTLLETLTAPAPPTGGTDIHWFYDYRNALFYVATQGTVNEIEVWERSGNALVKTEEKWYTGRQGVALDNIFDNLWLINDTVASLRFKKQTVKGTEEIAIYNKPISAGWTGEQLAVAPDGTIYATDPSGFHVGIVGGNRMWHFDPRKVYRKYDRSPSMTRFSRFSGGTKSGDFDTEIITQSRGSKIYSPIYDTNGFANTDNTSAWTFEFSDGGDADITFRGSNTAPDGGSSVTNFFSDIPQYSAGAWGTTVPSAEQGTPGSFRYKQAVLTVKTAAASAIITIQDLLDAISPQILCIEHDDETVYIFTDSTSPSNQVPVIPNQATPTSYFTQATASNRFQKQTTYLDDQSTGANEAMQTVSLITSDQQGQLCVVCRREDTATRNIILSVGTSGSANNRLLFRHGSSADGQSLSIEETNSAGTLINKVSAADTSLVYKRYDFLSNGSAWEIWFDRISQSLTVNTGANNGNWFGDLTTPNTVLRGTATGATGRGRSRLFLYKNAALTTAMNDLLDDYITQENLLA